MARTPIALILPLSLTLVACGEKKDPEPAATPGVALETALGVCGTDGQQAQLARLGCPGEDPVGQSERLGSLGPMEDGHMVDHFQVSCPDGSSHDVFLDLYHCDAADPLQAVGALVLLDVPPPPPIEPWQPGEGGIPLEKIAELPDKGVLLEVTDPGAEPRRALRFTPEVGQQETIQMRMLMSMEMVIGGQSAGAMALPPMLLDMDTEVTEVDGDEIQYSAAVTQAVVDRSDGGTGMPPSVLDELERSLKPLEGMQGYARITNTGHALEADFQLPPDAPADLAQQMSSFSDSAENLAAPVPDEPVGVGASWSVYTRMDSSKGFKIVQRADYALVELKDDRMVLEVDLVQQPLEANPQMDTLPPGAAMNMTRFESGGAGESVVRFDRLVPVASLATVDMDFAFSIEGDGQQVDAEMAMSMTMELTGTE